MGKKLTGKLIISLVITFVLILPTISQAQQKQRIKVVAQNASVRMQPNIESEVILTPPVGSTFEVEQKIGDWYEIKFSSEIGVLITGYINSQFVEVIEAEPVPVRKKEPVYKPVSPRAKPKRVKPPSTRQPRFNIKLGGLYSPATVVNDYTYSEPYLGEDLYIYEMFESPDAFGFSAGIGIFLTPKIELTGSVATFSGTPWWDWTLDLPSPYFTEDYMLDTTNSDEFSAEPTYKRLIFSFGLNYYLIKSNYLDLYIGGGGSSLKATAIILANDFSADHNWYPISQTHDVVINWVTYEEIEFSVFGFNARAGINIKVSSMIALFAEAMYIYAKVDHESPYLFTNDVYSLDLGGIQSIFGIKILF